MVKPYKVRVPITGTVEVLVKGLDSADAISRACSVVVSPPCLFVDSDRPIGDVKLVSVVESSDEIQFNAIEDWEYDCLMDIRHRR